MPSSVRFKKNDETKFSFPFRMFLSGSSESGKTYFAEKILKRNDLFMDTISYVSYHYPCELPKPPVEWEKSLDMPVNYQIGLPTMTEIMNLPENSCIVLDDLYDEVVKSRDIDYLFRVISSKRKICVMVMTQYIFTKSNGIARQIRNNSNFTVLFRNCADVNMNKRACQQLGISQAYTKAERDISGEQYPYMFIDQTPKGAITGNQLFTNIFNKYQQVYNRYAMKGYIISELDFKNTFKITGVDKAKVRNEYSKICSPKNKTDKNFERNKTKRRKLGQRSERFVHSNQESSELQSKSQ